MDDKRKKYLILNTPDLTDDVLKHCASKLRSSQRFSLDGKKVLIKLEGEKPECLYQYKAYPLKKIKKIILGQEWNVRYQPSKVASFFKGFFGRNKQDERQD